MPSFHLDNDVDVRCRGVLEKRGFVCTTAHEAGLSDAGDDDQTVYAMERGAVLVTHDQAFTTRRKKAATGRHLQLRCAQPDAIAVLEQWIDDAVPVLDRRPDVVVVIHKDGFDVIGGEWSPASPE